MDYKLEEKEGCVRKYSFKISWEELKGDYEQAIESVSKEAEIPGFRKGKAPIELVKAKYKNPIEGEVKSKLLQKAAEEIIKKENIKLFSDPGASDPQFAENEGFSGYLFFETYPEVPEIEYNDLEIKLKKTEITNEQVNNIVDLYRSKFAEIKTMDNETIAEGDYCSAKLISETGSPEEDIFVMCSERSYNAIERFLVGKKCGESYEMEIGENQSKPKGKYRISVKNVVRKVLPELNNELAVKSGFSSLDELMAKSREKAKYENEEREREQRNNAIVRALVDKYKFDIPATLLDRQLRNDADAVANQLQKQGADISKFDWDKYFDLRKTAVENNIRAYFIVSKLIEQEKIVLEEEEVDTFLSKISDSQGLSMAKVREILEKNGQMEDIKFKLAEEKALENISKYVKIKYLEETPEKDKGGNNADTDSR